MLQRKLSWSLLAALCLLFNLGLAKASAQSPESPSVDFIEYLFEGELTTDPEMVAAYEWFVEEGQSIVLKDMANVRSVGSSLEDLEAALSEPELLTTIAYNDEVTLSTYPFPAENPTSYIGFTFIDDELSVLTFYSLKLDMTDYPYYSYEESDEWLLESVPYETISWQDDSVRAISIFSINDLPTVSTLVYSQKADAETYLENWIFTASDFAALSYYRIDTASASVWEYSVIDTIANLNPNYYLDVFGKVEGIYYEVSAVKAESHEAVLEQVNEVVTDENMINKHSVANYEYYLNLLPELQFRDLADDSVTGTSEEEILALFPSSWGLESVDYLERVRILYFYPSFLPDDEIADLAFVLLDDQLIGVSIYPLDYGESDTLYDMEEIDKAYMNFTDMQDFAWQADTIVGMGQILYGGNYYTAYEIFTEKDEDLKRLSMIFQGNTFDDYIYYSADESELYPVELLVLNTIYVLDEALFDEIYAEVSEELVD